MPKTAFRNDEDNSRRFLYAMAIIPIQNNKVVLFDTGKILNARPAITLTNSKPITWRKGIDGGGLGDGY